VKRSRHWWWLWLVPLALGLGRLRFDADVLNLLPAELPEVRGLQLHQRYFAPDTELLVTVSAPDAEAAARAAQRVAETLRAERTLVAAALWRPPWWENPAATAELLAWLWLNQPPAEFAALAGRLAPPQLAGHLENVRDRLATSMSPAEIGRLANDPLGFSALPAAGLQGDPEHAEEGFAARDGTFRLVLVTPAPAWRGFARAADWLAQVRARLDRLRATPDWPAEVTLGFTGPPAFAAEAAAGMRTDLRRSVAGTLGVILILFWLAHRRWTPLLWLVALLQVVLLGTAALGGLLLGTLNLVSLGFAAVLLGLSVDYGLVLYQEARSRPDAPPAQIRQWTGRAIWGSALTTAAAFALLLLGGLPGLGQLGLLVALGVLLGAAVMLHVYLPRVCHRRPSDARAHPPDFTAETAAPAAERAGLWTRRLARPVTIGLLMLGAGLLACRWPAVDHTTRPLGPRDSAAETAMRELEARLGRGRDSLLVLVAGTEPGQVRERLTRLDARLKALREQGAIAGFELPLALWPAPEIQAVNLQTARGLAQQAGPVLATLSGAGFSTEVVAFARAVFEAWQRLAVQAPPVWPEGEAARWLLTRAAARTPEGWLALGAVHGASAAAVRELADAVAGALVTGWPRLGDAVLRHVETRTAWLLAGLGVAVALCLRLTLGGWGAVGWSFAALAFGVLLLLGFMAAAGWSWNLMNLTALPLLLGAGVDYSIHVQLALRRHHGRPAALRHTTGRALWLCAGTTVAAFGSLAGASNAGLASLGAVCAVGVAAQAVSALYFLPAWTYAARRHSPPDN
jgi:predicted exporter